MIKEWRTRSREKALITFVFVFLLHLSISNSSSSHNQRSASLPFSFTKITAMANIIKLAHYWQEIEPNWMSHIIEHQPAACVCFAPFVKVACPQLLTFYSFPSSQSHWCHRSRIRKTPCVMWKDAPESTTQVKASSRTITLFIFND